MKLITIIRSFPSTASCLKIRSLQIFTVSAILFLTACASDQTRQEQGEGQRQIIVQNVTVIDAVDGLRENQSVVVSGDQIVAVGEAEDIAVPEGAEVVDGQGRYLIPGLWDAHVHLTNTPAMRQAMFPLMIVNGITYVRDTAAELDDILAMREESVRLAESEGMAPDVYILGHHIDGRWLSWDSSVSAVTPEEALAHMNELEEVGVDEMKVYELLSPEVFHTVVQEAADRGYKVTAHVPLTMDVVEASDAGLSAMEHMQNLELSCSGVWQEMLDERRQLIAEGTDLTGNEFRQSLKELHTLRALQTQDDERCSEVLGTLARNQTWQIPTLTITTLEGHRLYDRPQWRETFRYLPEQVEAAWLEQAEQMSQTVSSEAGLAYSEWVRTIIPQLPELGIPVMAGTDMPLALLTPGFSLHAELELLAEAGLSPMQVLHAATVAPAEWYGLEEKQGRIAEGMAADLVLLGENPLEDITATRNIEAVVRAGFLHTRSDLDEILHQLESQ